MEVENGRYWYFHAQNNGGKGYGFSDLKKLVEDNPTSNLRFDFTVDGVLYGGVLMQGKMVPPQRLQK